MSWRQEFKLDVISAQIPVMWMGFRASIHELYRAGWEFRAEYDPHHMMQYLVMKHREHGIHARSKDGVMYFQWGQPLMVSDKYRGAKGFSPTEDVMFTMQIAGDITIQTHGSPTIKEVHSLDVVDFITPDHFERVSSMFPDRPTDEIIVPQTEDVMTMLSRIREMQAPRAKELLAEDRKKGELEKYQEQAQILTFKGVA